MWRLGLRPRYSFSGNICFEISVFCLCSVVDKVWLHHSPIPVGRRWVISPRSTFFYLPSLRVEEGGGRVSTLCTVLFLFTTCRPYYLDLYFLVLHNKKYFYVQTHPKMFLSCNCWWWMEFRRLFYDGGAGTAAASCSTGVGVYRCCWLLCCWRGVSPQPLVDPCCWKGVLFH
jgi:hypothetical protein